MYTFNILFEFDAEIAETRVLELGEDESLADLFESYYKIFNSQLRLRTSLIVVRPPVHIPLDPDKIKKMKMRSRTPSDKYRFLWEAYKSCDLTFSRVGVIPVHLLFSWDYKIYISENINPKAKISPLDKPKASDPTVIDKIKICEFDFLVSQSKAKLPAAPGVVYRAPSQALVQSFLRVGNVQYSRSAIDAVFFWLLPYLKRCVGIITDTWSISSISLNASRRLQVYRDATLPPCSVEMLSQYHDGSSARAAEAAEIVEQFFSSESEDLDKVVFLISATQTGSLVKNVKRSLNSRNLSSKAISFVAIFKLGTIPLPSDLCALRDLTGESGFQTISPDKDFRNASFEAIEIDDGVYFPLSYRNIEYGLKISEVTKSNLAFFSSYDDPNLVRVHRDVEDDRTPRHHGIWVDTGRLIEAQIFQKKFEDAILALNPKPELIVTPRHANARRLGALACGILSRTGLSVELVDHSTLWMEDSDLDHDSEVIKKIEMVPKNSAILILDDAFVTGSRLAGYQTHLRYRAFEGRLHYLVALARPSSFDDWELFRKRLGYPFRREEESTLRHTVQAVERILLPDWHSRQCPWCREIELYRRREIRSESIDDIKMRERLQFLQSGRVNGLVDQLFLEIDSLPSMKISQRSIFVLPSSGQASTFAAVASALQELRTCGDSSVRPLLGPRHYPFATVLNYKEYLVHTFTDSILRASILRATLRDELVYADQSSEIDRANAARNIVLADVGTTSNLAGELSLALADDRFPELEVTGEMYDRLINFGMSFLVSGSK